tara:strand:- start:11973 stop:12263 length:291 start_codon:yes stop_codon:yes gene_type:complete
MQIKLAEALLRRKELQDKVDRMEGFVHSDLFETQVQRKKVTDNIDDIIAKVAKVEFNQITKEYDYYAAQLRKIDAVIQQANWTTDVEVETISNYSE